MRAANEVNLRMAPLTPDHHFYIDQGANAHVRLVLIAIAHKLVATGVLEQADDVMFLRYNELRALIGDRAPFDAAALVQNAGQSERSRTSFARERGSAPRRRASSTSRTWSTGVSPRSSRARPARRARSRASVARRALSRGSPGWCSTKRSSTKSRPGDILVCHMTNPAWVVLFTKIAGLVSNAGGLTAHPAVLSREFGIPAVVGTQDGTTYIKTGDRIRVDGTGGIVDILETAPQPRNDLFTTAG